MTTVSTSDMSEEPGNSTSHSQSAGTTAGESTLTPESVLQKRPESSTRQEVELLVRAWRELSIERKALNRKVEQLKTKENLLKAWIIEAFRLQKFEGMLIDSRVTGLSSGKALTVEDKTELISYIYDNKALSILQFRLAESAIRERIEAGEEVPGVGEVEVFDLYDRKA